MLDGINVGIIDRLGLCEPIIVGDTDGLSDGLIDKEGIPVGAFCSEGLDDKVGSKVSDMVKAVVSVRSKLEADLITVLSRLSK